MDFTIALPERFRFGDWQVCLKSLILPSKVWNIYEETMPKWKFFTNLDVLGAKFNGMEFEFNQGSYQVVDILEDIQQALDVYHIPVEIFFNENRKRVTSKIKKTIFKKKEDYCTLIFNGYLNKILGFTVKDENRRYDLSKKSKSIDAYYTPNIHAYTPKSIIVTCDIVDETIFGGERLKLLRLITNKMDRSGDTIHYDFLHDEYIKLGTHEFDKIKIRISDVTGNLLKVDYSEIETRVQLEFREST